MDTLTHTEIAGVSVFARGKVRDVYAVNGKLLIIATDRISAFDVVLPNGIPWKGAVLTAISLFWFDFLKDVVPNHFLTSDISAYPEPFNKYQAELEGRSMLVTRADVVPFECVARGYLSGSGWKDYQRTGKICGVDIPPGLKESDRLPEPIFTPATKAASGHDINVSEQEMADAVGAELTQSLKAKTLEIYDLASRYAREHGIIIADTKFEFGLKDSNILLVDEALTPDSSRFWPEQSYQPGGPQQSYDKQFIRDYLETLDWDKTAPGPPLPQKVISRTSEKYLEAYHQLTGKNLTAT